VDGGPRIRELGPQQPSAHKLGLRRHVDIEQTRDHGRPLHGRPADGTTVRGNKPTGPTVREQRDLTLLLLLSSYRICRAHASGDCKRSDFSHPTSTAYGGSEHLHDRKSVRNAVTSDGKTLINNHASLRSGQVIGNPTRNV